MNLIAAQTVTNTLGIGIYNIEYGIEDIVTYKFSNDEIYSEATIYYDEESNAHFKDMHGGKWLLSEFIRC